MKRFAQISRKTAETAIDLSLDLDGTGCSTIATGIPFFDHMLEQISKHAFLDLTLKATGDLAVDFHHTVEDVGICLGEALGQALGERKGIRRYGRAMVPMDEALADVCLDLSNRPYLVFNGEWDPGRKSGDFDLELAREFFQALAVQAGITLHLTICYGRNGHHMIEAVFKAFAQAIAQAITLEAKIGDQVLSTKGRL